MSFLNKMTSLLSNDGTNILYSNMDNFKKHGTAYLNARKDVGYQAALNRKLPDSTDDTYREMKQSKTDQMGMQDARGASQRTLNTSQRHIDMAETERRRLKTAAENPQFRGEDGKLSKAGYEDVAAQQREAYLGQIRSRTEARNAMAKEAKDYFVGGDFTQNAARIGAATAAVGGVAVGTRYMSGGSVTHNNQGRRDIAGIPFV